MDLSAMCIPSGTARVNSDVQATANASFLQRERKIPLHAALNRVAQAEGFASRSVFVARLSSEGPARDLLSRLAPGDLMLLGTRPDQGKTLLCLELAVISVQSGG